MFFIQIYNTYWNKKGKSETEKKAIANIKSVLKQYDLLGICAELWRFMPTRAKYRWATDAVMKPSKEKIATLIAEANILTINTYNILKRLNT